MDPKAKERERAASMLRELLADASAPPPGSRDDGIVERDAGMRIRGIDEATRTVSFLASSEALDSYDEVVEQTWDFSRFDLNPVVLFAHNSRELPIGQSVRHAVVNGKLEIDVKFLEEKANPKAEQVYQCVLAKALRGCSVGFVPRDVRYEKRDGRDVYVLGNNLLHELSITPVGANPEALAKMKSKARDAAKASALPSATPQERGASAAGKPTTMSYSVIAATLGMADVSNATEATVTTHAKSIKERADRAEAVERELSDARTKLAASDKAHEAARVELAEAKAKLSEAETREKSLAARAKADATKIVDLELNELIGKKMLPSEKEGLLEIFAESPTLYAKQLERVKARADLNMTDTASVLGRDKSAPPATGTHAGGGSDELTAFLEKQAS
jgi:HK97 family phage prohead protease